MSNAILKKDRSKGDENHKQEASGPLSLVSKCVHEGSAPSSTIETATAKVQIIVISFLVIVSFCLCNMVSAASSSSALQKAKQEAEARGYTFFTSHDEIVAQAKKEGRLRVIAEMEPPTIKATTQAFMQRFPFIKLEVEELSGTGATQTNILQVKAGAARNWDILHLPTDFYNEYIPHIWKMDVLGMAQHGVIQIPAPMIDPEHRGVVAFYSRFQVAIYNKNLIPTQHLPRLWEDVLKPDFKGKKFAADIRPTEIAALVPAWGLERTLDFARKVAAQDPIWVRGSTRTIPLIIAGEVPMMIGPSFHTTRRIQKRDATGLLQYALLEPIPLRMALAEAIQTGSKNPYAALLWLEWMASSEAQKLADEHEPEESSFHVLGGAVKQAIAGKKLSVVSWEHNKNMEQWQTKVFEAYGFPKAN